MWEVAYSKTAQKDLGKLSPEVSQRICKKIRFFVKNKNPFFFAEKLTNITPPVYRFRIGKWRARFIIKNNTIFITRIRLRDKTY